MNENDIKKIICSEQILRKKMIKLAKSNLKRAFNNYVY